jgi:hypothetical protein
VLVPTSPPPGAARASALYDRALSTIAAAAGFHYVAVYSGTETIIGDAGRTVGRQLVTFKSSFGVEAFALLLGADGTMYFEGNQPALEDQLGVAAGRTPNADNRWISLSRLDGPYSELSTGMTVADQSIFVPMIPTSTGSMRLGGRTATVIFGTVTATDDPVSTAQLDIDSASHAPRLYSSTTSTSGGLTTSSVTFSAWNEAVFINPPTAVIAWSSLGASTPPDGFGGG